MRAAPPSGSHLQSPDGGDPPAGSLGAVDTLQLFVPVGMEDRPTEVEKHTEQPVAGQTLAAPLAVVSDSCQSLRITPL